MVTNKWLLILLEQLPTLAELLCYRRPGHTALVSTFSQRSVEIRCSYRLSVELPTDDSFGVTAHGNACVRGDQLRDFFPFIGVEGSSSNITSIIVAVVVALSIVVVQSRPHQRAFGQLW